MSAAFWNARAEVWLEVMLRACWQGALASLLIGLLFVVWKKAPASLRAWMWWLLGLRMLVALLPVSIGLPVLPANREPVALGVFNVREPILRSSAPSAAHSSIATAESAESHGNLGPTGQPNLPHAADSLGLASAAVRERLTPQAWCLLAWILCSASLAGFALTSLIRVYRVAGMADGVDDDDILIRAGEIARGLGLSQTPKLVVSAGNEGVMTLGAVRPIVVLPHEVICRCTPRELELILAHEFAHLVRWDSCLGIVPQLAQVVYFFNPLVWLASREFDLAREAACDEVALKLVSGRADEYAGLLLQLGATRRGARLLCVPRISSHFRFLRRRISMLDRSIQNRPFPRRASVFACIAAAICFAPWSLVRGQGATSPATHAAAAPVNAKSIPAKPVASTTMVKAKAKSRVTKVKPSGDAGAVFQLKHADAVDVVNILRQVETGKDRVQFAVDRRINAIVVHGKQTSINHVRSLIADLDNMHGVASRSPVERSMMVFPLRYANSGELAKIVSTTIAEPGLSIADDARTNSLVASGTRGGLEKVQAMLIQLDRPGTRKRVENVSGHSVRVFKLTYTSAVQLAQILSGMAKETGVDMISADARVNGIVVSASYEQLAQITNVIRSLDVPTPDKGRSG